MEEGEFYYDVFIGGYYTIAMSNIPQYAASG